LTVGFCFWKTSHDTLDWSWMSHNFMCVCHVYTRVRPYVFWQRFCKFLTFDMPNLAPKNMHVNWHAQFRISNVVWLCEEENLMLETRIARITRHVTLRWHFKRKNVNVNWQSVFVSEKRCVTLWIEVECQMKFTRSKKPQKSSKYDWSRANLGPKEFTLPWIVLLVYVKIQ